ncbi:MAG: lysoplasmalogenase family protein, partial [Sphingopyxis sp.]
MMRAKGWNALFWAAVLIGASYMLPVVVGWQGAHIIAWKGAGVALLALWAGLNARHDTLGLNGWLIAAVMALGALGDVLIEAVGLEAGALAFAAGHVVAIGLYLHNRRDSMTTSQRTLGLILIPASIIIALATQGPIGEVLGQLGSGQGSSIGGLLIYTALVSAMAASAWASRFSRYRVGIGAMLFLLSDLLIFASMGRFVGQQWPSLLIWPLYFAGQALIARGVVTT